MWSGIYQIPITSPKMLFCPFTNQASGVALSGKAAPGRKAPTPLVKWMWMIGATIDSAGPSLGHGSCNLPICMTKRVKLTGAIHFTGSMMAAKASIQGNTFAEIGTATTMPLIHPMAATLPAIQPSRATTAWTWARLSLI